MEDNDSGLPGVERFSLGVLPGNVAVDPAIPAQVSIQKDGNVSDSHSRAGSDQIGEREFIHEVVKQLSVFDQVRLGNIQRLGGVLLRLQFYSGHG